MFHVDIEVRPPVVPFGYSWPKRTPPPTATLMIYGEDLPSCQAAERVLLEELQALVLVPLEREMIPVIVGRGGDTLRSLRTRHGHVSIQMPDDPDNHSGELLIQRKADACRAVRDDVLALIQRPPPSGPSPKMKTD